jgi:multidrug resistance efflux pump
MELKPPLEPIPSPWRDRWRRRWPRVLQGLIFFLMCGAVAWLWRDSLVPAGFVGQVASVETRVTSRDDGLLTNLWVTLLQEVKAGDLVGEIITTDPRTINNRLEVMRDRMRLTQLEMDPILNRQRGALSYEQLAVDAAKERVALAVSRVNLDRARGQLKRDSELYVARVLSLELYEISKSTVAALEREVEERAQLVQRTEKSLERLAFMADTFLPGGDTDPLKVALAMEEDKIRIFEAKAAPLRLVAPTGGVVVSVQRHAGEQIRAGETLVTIAPKRGDHIVGYLPEGHPARLTAGMPVEVTTRGRARQRGQAVVTGVSPRWEPLTNQLIQPLSVRPVAVFPYVRVITVSLPDGMDLAPGQPVDLRPL